MEEKRALSLAQFHESNFNTNAYKFIETEGVFEANLDLKVWGRKNLQNFLTLEDGRKIIACTFPQQDYLGLADIPLNTRLVLTFRKAVRSGNVYIRDVKVKDACLIL